MQPQEKAEEPQAVVFTFNSENQARGHFELGYKLILLGGGLNSGKTALHPLDIHRRGRKKDGGRGGAETDQLGGIFTNTQTTLDKGVFAEISKFFRRIGEEQPVFNRRPPVAWVREWVREGIEIPSLAGYRNTLTTRAGVHVLCGTLSTIKASQQYDTIQLGWARIEEAVNNDLDANETITERVRCLTGGVSNPDCARYHHHTVHWIFNPPRRGHRWLFGKLDQLEEAAKNHYHALREGERCNGCVYVVEDGREFPRHHGPILDHRGWPLLHAGIGETILIRSKTSDNAKNQDLGYRTGLAAKLSKDGARRRLEGEILRDSEGRSYDSFSDANIRPVRYDADRTLYICLDFNLEPRAAVFAHPLNPGQGEYDTAHERPGLKHLGVFGEYFYAGEKSDKRFAMDLVSGARGDGCDSQPRYRDEDWRGLPPPCDEECIEAARRAHIDDNPDRPGRINEDRDLARAIRTCRKGHWNGLKGHRGPIVAFGDQRATYRSSHEDDLGSSWAIVEKVFFKLGNYARDVPEEQPSPRSRVDSVNGKLISDLDIRSLWIDPRCEELIRDFEQVMWDKDGASEREWRRGAMGTEWHRTHLVQALGYMVHRLFPGGDDVGAGALEVILEQSPPERRRMRYPGRR